MPLGIPPPSSPQSPSSVAQAHPYGERREEKTVLSNSHIPKDKSRKKEPPSLSSSSSSSFVRVFLVKKALCIFRGTERAGSEASPPPPPSFAGAAKCNMHISSRTRKRFHRGTTTCCCFLLCNGPVRTALAVRNFAIPPYISYSFA